MSILGAAGIVYPKSPFSNPAKTYMCPNVALKESTDRYHWATNKYLITLESTAEVRWSVPWLLGLLKTEASAGATSALGRKAGTQGPRSWRGVEP